MQKKNLGALLMGIFGMIVGVVGGLLWATCADACANIVGSSTGYTVGFIVLGIGGGVFSLIGGIQAYSFKGGKFGLSFLGFLMQIGNLILQCVFAEGFSFTLSLFTILAIIFGLIQSILARKEA